MSEPITVARPYAKAAFEYALETKALPAWAQMLAYCAEVSVNADMRALLGSPRVSAADKKTALFTVCEGKLVEGGKNFLETLAEHQRLSALPEICALFMIEKTRHEKTAEVEITSAIALSDAEKNTLCSKLGSKWSKSVQATYRVDANLIGGVVIRGNDVVIDGSVRGKLDRLAETLRA